MKAWLKLFLPLALVVVALPFYLGQARIDDHIESLTLREQSTIHLSTNMIYNDLYVMAQHLLSLTHESPITDTLADPKPANLQRMQESFVSLIQRNPSYVQVRWIDETGMEQVRINSINGNPQIVPQAELQSKANRYFFSEAMVLTLGEIYLSPLDLNVEHEQIEVPHRLMQRMATPVQDSAGKSRGILIINLLAHHFFEDIIRLEKSSSRHILLLNHQGHWLYNRQITEEGGFLLGDKESFGQHFPEAWARIRANSSGSMLATDGLWVWEQAPLKIEGMPTQLITKELPWWVVSHISGEEIAAIRLAIWKETLPVVGLLLIIVTVITLLIIASNFKQRADEQMQVDSFSASSRSWQVYVLAVVAPILILLLRLSLPASMGDRPMLLLFVFPITLSALLGGAVSGLIATFLSALLCKYWLILPFGTFSIASSYDLMQFLLLMANGVLISLVCETLIRARQVSEQRRLKKALLIQKLKASERALQERSQQLNHIFNLSMDLLFIVDMQGRFLRVNPAWEKVLGYQVQELENLMFGNLLHPDDYQVSIALLEDIQKGIQIVDFCSRYRTKDGNYRWLEWRSTPNDDGLIYAVARDITDRKLLEAEILTHREQLETQVVQRTQQLEVAYRSLEEYAAQIAELYNHAPCGYHSLNVDGTILRANQTELDWLGYTSDEFVGHPIVEFLTPESVDVFRRNFPEFIRTGRVRDLEFDFICKNGCIVSFMVSADLVYDIHGHPLHSSSTLLDIRERKARERKLHDLNQFLSEVLEVLPFGVVVYDKERKAILRNSLFGKLLNYPAELSQKEPLFFSDSIRFNFERGDYPDRSFEDVLAGFLTMMDSQQAVCFERQQADGVFLEIRGQQISNDWVLLTYTDISQHKLIEQSLEAAKQSAEAATSAKSAFLSNMSHEIRTPMNAVLGFCYLLEQKALDSDSHDLVKKIHTSGRNLLFIINDILDFSKIEAGRIEIENTPFYLHNVLENVSSVMLSLAGSKNLELIITPPTNIASLIGDELRLQQVLINLVGNAIKFTEQGEVSLIVTCVQEIENEVWLRFSVKDTGIGISEDQQGKLFEAFSQADTSISRRFGGTGLGLAISQRLVELMGGQLQVHSGFGIGSEFWFVVPFHRSSDADNICSHETLNHLQLLIADDNDAARKALQQTVFCLGWKADVVNSGEALIAQVLQRLSDQQTYDVLLIDWMMPQMDGLTTAQQLRELLPSASQSSTRLPIVLIVNAYSKEQLVDQPGLEAIDGVLTKPITLSALYDAIVRLSGMHQNEVSTTLSDHEDHIAGIRLLVVDDSDINREVAKRILEAEGAIVTLANDGQYAVDWLLAHEQEVDLVLMDIQMPRLDGYEATRKIREYPQFAALPILALTAGAFRTLQEAAFDAGMNDFIAKPFNVDLMLEKIKHWTKQHSKLQISGNVNAINTVASPSEDFTHLNLVTDLPDLPGIDMAQGLKIWGSINDFQTYLLRFKQQYQSAGQDMLVCLEQGNIETIANLAHKLKGAAFSVALQNIPELCNQIEATLYESEQLTNNVKALQVALDDIAHGLDLWIPKPMLLTPSNEEQQLIRNQWSTIVPLLTKLMLALDEDNLSNAEDIIRNLENLMHQYYLEPIKAALTEFNLREAEKQVRALMSTFTP